MNAGVSIYVGPGYVLHVSTEDGIQVERAPHKTWRFGFLLAVRKNQSDALAGENDQQINDREYVESVHERYLDEEDSIRLRAIIGTLLSIYWRNENSGDST